MNDNMPYIARLSQVVMNDELFVIGENVQYIVGKVIVFLDIPDIQPIINGQLPSFFSAYAHDYYNPSFLSLQAFSS
ncbi:hypothetical protein C1752_14869 [Acaryochloris thomasi RCC1774]|uniref:Uncharacterized protein n=1 Tax=Acaryochloris thomasi RCC1774 TaxID=1764569 RepID=A0A2W1J7U5_9CYAN|nr:hypothetical protein C1752_14869 [Acaryochloris thomasi RCC1774]